MKGVFSRVIYVVFFLLLYNLNRDERIIVVILLLLWLCYCLNRRIYINCVNVNNIHVPYKFLYETHKKKVKRKGHTHTHKNGEKKGSETEINFFNRKLY